jgi:amidohydrolase
MTKTFEDEAASLQDELVAFRRLLHRHPEPSWEEHRTSAAIAERLSTAGLEPRLSPTGTGVLCDIGEGGPVVALRGDIDALRMPDLKEVPYRSEVEGVCHACGHDVHTTCVLGAGLAMARAGLPVDGRVRLIFQPAEEAIPGGASAMVEAGVVDDVSAIFGLHCDPSQYVGTLGLSRGPITSASDQVIIRVKGPGGHTGRPHRTVDVVHVLAKLAAELPGSLARLSDPRDAVNLTFGSIHAGDAPNVIPTEGVLRGSLRAAGRASWEESPAKLRALVASIAEPFGASWELDHLVGAPPVLNDPWALSIMEGAAQEREGVTVQPTPQSGGGEDFSWFLDKVPGAYARLGVRPPGGPQVDIHASTFDVDEAAIGIGVHLLGRSALRALGSLGTR